ncbi:tetratricopeptide repeat protein [Acetobacter okinawensis]|uniref:tetratricopeptide repeat protein n=1 Tax=Acetobacter okinawensis TaxID=1076594 RepID=UPI00046FD5B1|nr:tetratricopeptide repeat protein [Acetobacter okinawensis]MCP1212846.1 tetratricopeptide repeat protein [Acetobacter okinawensis]
MTMRFVRGLLCSATVFSLAVPAAYAADTLGQPVGAALQQAQSALAAHNYTKALAAVNEADSVAGKSAYEDYTIAQMRAAVASQAGDVAQATAAYEKLIASPRTPRNLKNQMLMSEGTMAYNAKDYPKAVLAIQRYLKDVGPNPQMETLLAQSYYLQKDYAGTVRVLTPIIARTVKAGQKPVESQLQMLAASATALKDSTTATHAYVLLASDYPKKEYWALLLHELVVNTKIPPALQLDVYRIRLAAGDISTARDFMEMTEIAMQGHMPQLALDLMDQGYKQGILGQGAEAPRQARLKALVEKTIADKKASIAEDEKAALAQTSGNALLNVGYNYVTFGQADKGLALMEQAIAKGVTDPNIARLHLGLAQMQAGNKAAAIQTLKSVAGDNGAYDIAQLWVLKLG